MRSPDPLAEDVLARLVTGHREALGPDLVGTYLFGSAATGAFEVGTSDVDTVALLRVDPTAAHLAALGLVHDDIVREMPDWENRVETVYISTTALRASLSSQAPALRISPGEPLHPIAVDPSWILDWYQLQSVGIVLIGPSVGSVAPHVTKGDYVEAVRQHLLDPGWLDAGTAGDRCYAILTMCRGLCTCIVGDHVSKADGAAWAAGRLPEHATLIRSALTWRSQPHDRRDDRLLGEDATRRLVAEVQARIR